MLKKIAAFVMCTVIAAVSAIPAFAQTEEVALGVPTYMVVLGDSIATGFGLEGYNNGKTGCDSYANLLGQKFSDELPEGCSFTLENLAVDGKTSADLLGDLNSGADDEALAQADCVIVSIGGNDLLAALWGILSDTGITNVQDGINEKTAAAMILKLAALGKDLDKNLETFESNLTRIAAYLDSHTEGMVVIQTLYDPLESFSLVPGISELSAQKLERFNEIIRNHSADAGGSYTVCDIVPEFKGKADTLTNIKKFDIHPTAAGHAVIAEQLDKTVRTGSFSYTRTVEETVSEPEPAAESVTESAAEPASKEEPVSKEEPAPEQSAEKASVITTGAEDGKKEESSFPVVPVAVAAGVVAVGAAAVIIIKKRAN